MDNPMTSFLRLASCLLILAALAACNKNAPAATDAATPASAATTTEAAAPAQSATPAGSPDAAPVTLTMERVTSYTNALKSIAAAQKADPEMGDVAQDLSEEDSAQYTARLEADPKLRAAIEAAGLSVREFVGIGDTLLGAMMAQGALEAGQLKTLPEGIDPASVEFVKQHKAELKAVMGGGDAD
jgi:hypothetical protein